MRISSSKVAKHKHFAKAECFCFGILNPMNESNHGSSHIDPEILNRMTPEGQDLAQRVLESTDMVISVSEVRNSTAPESRLEHQEPGLIERAKRLIGLGTFNIINMEGQPQSEQRMVHAYHTRGTKAFRVGRSAETKMKKYTRPADPS